MPPMSKLLVEEIEPKFEWVKIEGCDTLLVHLPGYLKENLKVQVTTSRNLRVLGERKGTDGKSSRFQKEFSLSEDCDVNQITAKFEAGVLKIRLPKMAGSALKKEEGKQETKHTASATAAAAAGTEDEKTGDKADEPLAKAQVSGKLKEKIDAGQKENEGDGISGEKPATEEMYKKKSEWKSRVKKATLLAVLIVGVGVAVGIRMLQSKGNVSQMVKEVGIATMNSQKNMSNISCIC